MSEQFTTSKYVLKVLDPAKNKRAEHMAHNYFSWAKDSTIWTIYGKPCDKNAKAYFSILEDKNVEGGIDFRCGSRTLHSWCCGYRLQYNDNLSYLIYHTRDNVYCIVLQSKPIW